MNAPRVRAQRGFTIVELMIAALLGLLLLAGVVQVFLSNKQTYSTLEGVGRIQENLRFAATRISDEIAQAGSFGCSAVAPDETVAGTTDYSLGIEGVEGSVAGATTDSITLRHAVADEGLPLDNPMASGTDVLRVDNDAEYDTGDFKIGQILVVTDCANATVFRADPAPVPDVAADEYTISHSGPLNDNADLGRVYGYPGSAAAWVHKVYSTTFLIQDSPRLYAPGVPIRSLFVIVDDGNGVPTTDELVQGVRDMEIQYGEDTDGDGTADRYLDWADGAGPLVDSDRVRAVRITLTLDSVRRANASDDGRIVASPYTFTVRLRGREA